MYQYMQKNSFYVVKLRHIRYYIQSKTFGRIELPFYCIIYIVNNKLIIKCKIYRSKLHRADEKSADNQLLFFNNMSTTNDFPIVLVKNLPYTVSTEALYELFGNFGNIHQIRIPDNEQNKGTCFVIYNNLANANTASKSLNGINFQGRYLVSLLYSVDKSKLSKEDIIYRKEQLENLKIKYSI